MNIYEISLQISRGMSKERMMERRKAWWADKKEWFRLNYQSKGKSIPNNDKLNAMVARMWNIMGEGKKEGVLDGSYDYTGKGLNKSPQEDDMGEYGTMALEEEM